MLSPLTFKIGLLIVIFFVFISSLSCSDEFDKEWEEYEKYEGLYYKGLDKFGVPTLRPKRFGCTPPAIEQFPEPLMSKQLRKHGGLLINIIIAIYVALALVILCDDYFVPSVKKIRTKLGMSQDAAGATLMAFGSSAPTLATLFVGLFFGKDDVGPSTIIGTSIFNLTFAVGLCAICSGTVLQLNWRSNVRDCFIYCLSVLVLIFVIIDGVVGWKGALLMLTCFVIYCIAVQFKTHDEEEGKQENDEAVDTPIINEDSNTVHKQKTFSTSIKTWRVLCPINYLFNKTMSLNDMIYLTFAISIFWICIFSYFLVWMTMVIGYTLEIPDAILSVTFVAAAMSFPAVLNSIILIKKSHGNMAIANLMGTNIFNILFCLGLPWFIQMFLIRPKSHVNVIGKGIFYTTFTLLSITLLFLITFFTNARKLNKKMGFIMMSCYILITVFSSIYCGRSHL